MPSLGWACPFARPVGVRNGPELRTIGCTRLHADPIRGEQNELRWQSAARKLLEACETGEVEAATRRLESASPPSADIARRGAEVRLVPTTDLQPVWATFLKPKELPKILTPHALRSCFPATVPDPM